MEWSIYYIRDLFIKIFYISILNPTDKPPCFKRHSFILYTFLGKWRIHKEEFKKV